MPASWKRLQSACRGLRHLAGAEDPVCLVGKLSATSAPSKMFQSLASKKLKNFLSSNTRSAQHHDEPKPSGEALILENVWKPSALVRRGRTSPSTWMPGDSVWRDATGTPQTRFSFCSCQQGQWPWAEYWPSLRFSVL